MTAQRSGASMIGPYAPISPLPWVMVLKNLTVGHAHDALVVQIGHGGHDANFLGDAIAVAESAMTGRAVNLKLFAAAREQCPR